MMSGERYAYDVLETALSMRHRLMEEDLDSIRTRIRHLRNAGFPEPGPGPGRALTYDGDGLVQLVLAHELIAYGAAPTWAARTVRTAWSATRDALIRASNGERLHLSLHPSAMNDTLKVATDINAQTSGAFKAVDTREAHRLLDGDGGWRIMLIGCEGLMDVVHDALRQHGHEPERLFRSSAPQPS